MSLETTRHGKPLDLFEQDKYDVNLYYAELGNLGLRVLSFGWLLVTGDKKVPGLQGGTSFRQRRQ